MKIFDCHVHAESGMEKYDLQVDGRNYIFNTVASYNKFKRAVTKADSATLVFDYKNNLIFVKGEIATGAADALKVHSRIQQLTPSDFKDVAEQLKGIPPSVPVIVDSFHWGHDMAHQPNLAANVELMASDSSRTWVLAHSGGYDLLKYYVHLRGLKNVYYDLSMSLEYFSDSSVFADIKKLIRWTDKSRIMFGSDFHDGSPKRQFDILTQIFNELKLSDADRQMIAAENAIRLYKRPK